MHKRSIVIVRLLLVVGLLIHTGLQGGAHRFIEHVSYELHLGRIDSIDAVNLQLQAIYAPQDLPLNYRGLATDLILDPTFIKAEAKQLMAQADGLQRVKLQQWFQRPDSTVFNQRVISPSGRFKIHYAAEGVHQTMDDFARQCAEIYDQVYSYEIDVLGYRPPPSDDGRCGPEYDIYMRNMAAYGSTTEEERVEGSESRSFSSFIEMDNNFTHTPTRGIDALRVTAAHEFFHMIQLGYRGYSTVAYNERFFYEMSSTWMEDVVFDSINDYYYYLDPFFTGSDQAFYLFNGSHEYGSSVFLHMLEKKYGRNITRQFWTELEYVDLFQAFQAVFQNYGSNFNRELAEFSVWNVHTGQRADTLNFYPQGKHYPLLLAKNEHELIEEMIIEGQASQLQTLFYRLTPRIPGDYIIQPQSGFPADWMIAVLERYEGGQSRWRINSGAAPVQIRDVSLDSEIWLSVVNTSRPGNGFFPLAEPFAVRITPGIGASQLANQIHRVYPSPFFPNRHGSISIEFSLLRPSNSVNLSIVTLTGEVILSKNLGWHSIGYHVVEWDGKNEQGQTAASGIYLVQILCEEKIQPVKIALIR
ncbi:hypothetical protein JW992_02270 [candidate division KSB1 bacterium]|nr:hypothetical protein [candidate division KSB1 bacterium]